MWESLCGTSLFWPSNAFIFPISLHVYTIIIDRWRHSLMKSIVRSAFSIRPRWSALLDYTNSILIQSALLDEPIAPPTLYWVDFALHAFRFSRKKEEEKTVFPELKRRSWDRDSNPRPHPRSRELANALDRSTTAGRQYLSSLNLPSTYHIGSEKTLNIGKEKKRKFENKILLLWMIAWGTNLAVW